MDDDVMPHGVQLSPFRQWLVELAAANAYRP